MIAARIVVKDNGNTGSKVMLTYRGKNVLKPYDRKNLLQVLCLYSKWHCPTGTEQMKEYFTKVRSALFKARCDYGTQFLLELFLMTEEYIKHWPNFAFHITRNHIIHVMNQCPDFRIRYEE